MMASRSMTVIASTAESMIARILATFSLSAAWVSAASVMSRVMKTARVGGPSGLRNARPRVSSVISCPSACWARNRTVVTSSISKVLRRAASTTGPVTCDR